MHVFVLNELGECCRMMSVCPSVRHCVQMSKHIDEILSPSLSKEAAASRKRYKIYQ